uniref:Uncharacterized protein n=1 Tax=Alexandrium andersonii TaxID=327968 RepID=A0A7S2BG11_9DINO|mmetsp:Transcript_25591/g.58117  ORF Transcript_25591/g.58117 Transcript_25591/m.58117 type:complete len:347 (+) Transcript_25591:137-1177(+)
MTDSSLAGNAFHEPVIIFVASGYATLCIYRVLLCAVQRRRGRLDGDGFLVSHFWSVWTKRLWSYIILTCLLTPLAGYTGGLAFGSVLAAVEGWDTIDGINYVFNNLGVLPVRLTTVSPVTPQGALFAVFMNFWLKAFTCFVVGISSYSMLMINVYKSMPGTVSGFLRIFLVYMPVMLAVLAFVYSLLLSSMEQWSLLDAFICVASKFAGLTLGRFRYTTTRGLFIVGFAYYVQLSISGAILGMMFSHPLLLRFVQYLEGTSETDSAKPQESAGEAKHEAGAWDGDQKNGQDMAEKGMPPFRSIIANGNGSVRPKDAAKVPDHRPSGDQECLWAAFTCTLPMKCAIM